MLMSKTLVGKKKSAGKTGPANKKKAEKKEKGKKEKKPPTPQDRFKWEVASILGYQDKVKKIGWGGLSAAETGR